MNAPTVESIATLAGRELDTAVHRFVIGESMLRRQPMPMGKYKTHPTETIGGADSIPHYSTDPAAFFALMEKVRENGWTVEIIENLSPDESDWLVRLTFCHGGQYSQRESGGDTLPLAFARAALLTTITGILLRTATHDHT